MSKIRESAKGQACTIRLDGCNGGPNNETVVLAHLNNGSMGKKSLDIHGAYACASCHDLLDSRTHVGYRKDFLLLTHLMGMKRTQEILVSKGLL